MKLAIIYDRVNKFGGAERVLLALHEIFPKAPLFTAVYNTKTAKWANAFEVKTTFLQYLPFAKTHHELYPWLTPFAFKNLDLSQYDVILSVTSAEAKFISKNKNQLHICYCLTPTRYLWSHYDFYQKQGFSGKVLSFFSPKLKKLDLKAAANVDHFIAISKEVQKRIKKYYHRDSLVIYPPVDICHSEHSEESFSAKDFFLIVSRLVPYKRIDLAIKACNQLKKKLIIIGTGSQLKYLQKIAGPTIAFKGHLTDSQIASYYKNCKALIFTSNEDFGIVPVEAQSYGKPVIALAKGGALETVISDKTGVFFKNQSVDSLKKAILKFEKLSKQGKIKPSACFNNAKKFDKKIFKKQIKKIINTFYKNFKSK